MPFVWNVNEQFGNMEVEFFDVSHVINGSVRMTNLSIKRRVNSLKARLFIAYHVTGWVYTRVSAARYASVMSMSKVSQMQTKKERH